VLTLLLNAQRTWEATRVPVLLVMQIVTYPIANGLTLPVLQFGPCGTSSQ
jgi:hypothetical protein